MKITKLGHSCLLVEMPEPVNRTVLFDPGDMSVAYVRAANLKYLDDIVITHEHFDHLNLPLIKELVGQFPGVRILGPESVATKLTAESVAASTKVAEGLELFDAPHEKVEPLATTPQAIGVHYLDKLSHPGDSHSFSACKSILALPVTAPWGTTVRAIELAAQLKPQYVIPIHDWMWREEWRTKMYDGMEGFLKQQGITFIKPTDGEPFILNV